MSILLKKTTYNFFAKFSLLIILVSGMFSFCFAHEVLAHDSDRGGETHPVVELHDTHCAGNIVLDRFVSGKNDGSQIVQKYFPITAIMPLTSIAYSSFFLESPPTGDRAKPPDTHVAPLQILRC